MDYSLMRHSDIIPPLPDVLSDSAHALLAVNPDAAYTHLVVVGGGNPQAKSALQYIAPDQLVARPITQAPYARLLLAGLWLWHDWLDESHKIAQQIETPDGSYWHAIMHRREGDFSNSQYWFARCAEHPIIREIAARLPDLIAPRRDDAMVARLSIGGWNPTAFVKLVEHIHSRPDDPRHSMAVAIQRLEWNALFVHCAQRATA